MPRSQLKLLLEHEQNLFKKKKKVELKVPKIPSVTSPDLDAGGTTNASTKS